MCFNVLYHVQCVAESTTKDIPSRNLGFITNSRFRCSALYNFECIFYIFERDNYLPNFIFIFAATYIITYVQIQIRPWHVDQYLNDTKLYFFSHFEKWVNGRNLDVKIYTIK